MQERRPQLLTLHSSSRDYSLMDWNSLPRDLVDLILHKLFVKDRHNFSLVSQSWNQAVVATSWFGHSPCLMFNQRTKKHLWKFSQHNNFFCMDFPKLEDARIRFSNHGWLLISRDDDETLFFFDPFNNRTIELPSPGDSECVGYTTMCFFHPPTNSDCFIVGIVTELDDWYDTVEIGVLKHGENQWKSYTYKSHKFQVSLGPPILHGGLLYFLDARGNVATFDIREHGYISSWKVFPKCFRKRRIRNNIKEHFLIKPKGEETIFAVFAMHGERAVKVFRLSKEFLWESVKNLGDKVFYVSNGSAFGYTSDVESMMNKIFFPKFHADNVVYYSLDTQRYHSFKGDYSNDNSHGLQRVDFATWIIPLSTDAQLSEEPLAWCL